MRKSFFISASVLFAFLVHAAGFCLELTPKEILQRADEARGNLEGLKWTVHIISRQGENEQEREIYLTTKGYNFYAFFESPSKVKGQKLLMADHNMWFTKPGLRKPVPISPRQKLLGGASYGDIAATNYAEDYEILSVQEDIVQGEPCYVFDLKAVNGKATYDRVVYWISKKLHVGKRAEFFSVSGKKLKVATFEYDNEVHLNQELRPFISKMIIADTMLENTVTVLSFYRPLLEKVPDSRFDLNLFTLQ